MQPACVFYTKVKINFNKGIVSATPLFIISWMLRQNILSSGLKCEKFLKSEKKFWHLQCTVQIQVANSVLGWTSSLTCFIKDLCILHWGYLVIEIELSWDMEIGNRVMYLLMLKSKPTTTLIKYSPWWSNGACITLAVNRI